MNPREAQERAGNIIAKQSEIAKRDCETIAFMQKLLEVRKIKLIYYPGNGSDFSLDQVFKTYNIQYLDSHPQRYDVVEGDYGDTPKIPDRIFDAVFIQDLHVKRMQISEILRTVARDGLVIISAWRCGDEARDDLAPERIPEEFKFLEPYPLVSNDRFRVFKKVVGD